MGGRWGPAAASRSAQASPSSRYGRRPLSVKRSRSADMIGWRSSQHASRHSASSTSGASACGLTPKCQAVGIAECERRQDSNRDLVDHDTRAGVRALAVAAAEGRPYYVTKLQRAFHSSCLMSVGCQRWE